VSTWRRRRRGGLSWPLEELSDGELEAGLFPPPGSSGARPSLDYAHIHEELRRHRELTLLQLWVEYAENNPGAYGYSRYCELYGRWRKKLNPTMRQRHRAGEKTFVDFSGKKPHIVDAKTGELVEMELFVATLGASSYTYVEATLDQSLELWTKAHGGMSDFFGGSTEIWVPDNLKSGVELADREYSPRFQSLENTAFTTLAPTLRGRGFSGTSAASRFTPLVTTTTRNQQPKPSSHQKNVPPLEKVGPSSSNASIKSIL